MYDAGIFLKNYMEFVEELPDDLQKCISICRENDLKTRGLIREVEQISVNLTDKKSSKLQQILVNLTELKDEKIKLSQSLSAFIENKYKAVDDSYQNNVVIKQEERSPTPKNVMSQNNSTNTSNSKITASTIGTSNNSKENSASENQEKMTKRIRKTRIDNLDDSDSSITPQVKSEKSVTSSSNACKRASSTSNPVKKVKKRKTTKKQQATPDIMDDVNFKMEDEAMDETTYCICQQISYGEMIFCENDTCKIEWFHFSCVDLTAKPKGRWFCPQCRGDRPNVINKNLRKKQQDNSI